jgi:hypothetical protein
MRIHEGRMLERPCPHCGGLERRAFGESVSAAGELASYAIGWTAPHEERVGYLTVGIGAGNPGGGTFHAEVRPHEGRYGMGLVDRPFEDVPEGGPDLSREQALEHPDLRYVWWVADEVMAQDRRAIWMFHWLSATPAFAGASVIDGEEPARTVAREAEQGGWRLLGRGSRAEDGQLVQLYDAVERDPSLLDVLDLAPGQRAERRRLGGGWKRRG